MKELIWNLKAMYAAKKYRHTHDDMEREYQWYKYLVKCDIHDIFFAWFRFTKSKDEIPF